MPTEQKPVKYSVITRQEVIHMQLQSTKQEAMDVISRLPESTDMEEIMYRLYVLENVRRGQTDATLGKHTATEQLRQEIQTW